MANCEWLGGSELERLDLELPPQSSSADCVECDV